MQTRLTECWTPQRRVHLDRVLLAACAMALMLLSAPLALAQSVRVAVIHTVAQDEAARRLRAEVSAAGLSALDMPVSASDPRSTAKIAHLLRAVAALRIRPEGDLETVVVDLQTGKVLDRTLLPAQESVAELQLTAVEDLRAKLVELSIALPPLPAEVPGISAKEASPVVPAVPAAPPAPAAAADSRAPQPISKPTPTVTPAPLPAASEPIRRDGAPRAAGGVWLQFAAGGAISSGGLNPNALSRVGLRLEPWERWSISALTLLPLSSQKVTATSGSATVDLFVFGGMLGLVSARSRSVALELGLGGGAALSRMQGFPTRASDVGRSESVWSGVALADASLAWRLAVWLRVRVAALAGMAAPRPTVRFDGEPVASWGRPFASGTLGLELEPFRAAQGSP